MARALDRPRPSRIAAIPAAIGGLLRRLPQNRGALAILACIVLITSFSLAALPGFVDPCRPMACGAASRTPARSSATSA